MPGSHAVRNRRSSARGNALGAPDRERRSDYPQPLTYHFASSGSGAFSWEQAPDLTIRRTWASGVLMAGGTEGSTRVALIGGADYEALLDTGTSTPLASTETFDEQNPDAGWLPGPSLNVPRAHQNTVLLPDGSMATVGGGYGILDGNRRTGDPALHRQIELYDRASDSWRLGPAQDELRTYHSTALLLPDARVLSAGDDVNGGSTSDTGEIYEPPYLFKGARPTIDSAPSAIGHGSTFAVTTHDHVAKAVLIAPGAATHANDMNQRYVSLKLSQRPAGDGVDLVAPPNPNIAPPGYYMLLLLSDDGVPSVAKFVRLTIPPKPATIEVDPPVLLSFQEVTLTATAGEGGAPISRVQWDLDADGSFDDGASNPIKTAFPSPGSHVVRVRVTDESGGWTTSERALTVGNRVPTATISFSPSQPSSLEPVSFTVSAADPDGVIASHQWDLDGDGAFDDGDALEAARSFPRKGSYVARARVSDDLGASTTATVAVVVANRPPVASFSYSPPHPAPLEPVTFMSTSSDADGTVSSTQWDTDDDGGFDDAVGATATRTYAAPGIYPISLRVADNDGDTSFASDSVSVNDGTASAGPPAPSRHRRA
jgi:PKD repeat protein